MSESDDCLFCKIIAGQIPSSKVYEDETTYAFNDINPKAKVHVLVVPKFNTGLDAGQTVFHVHAHVMTGEKLDE